MIINCLNCKKEHKACRRTQKYCSASCQMNYYYANGGKARVSKAHEALRGKKFPDRDNTKLISRNKSEAMRKKNSEGKTGKQVPNLQGINHWNWKGGNTKTYWKTPEYQAWRKSVFRRDNYTCVDCGDDTGGNLEADHIKPRLLFPELIHDVDNGRTLCKDCHRQTISWGAKVKQTTRGDYE